jgi:exopolyphosphatase/guanosine-5'-triphosphate,3'-diphosphate pyrophosphatase
VVKKNPIVAVIDIGSNSIKSLAATRGAQGELIALQTGAIDARISTGISQAQPRLSDAGMEGGLAAIRQLLVELGPLAPDRTELVATSAMRDAANGAEFRARVRAATGRDIRILTGAEEAEGIGRGLTSDPALAGLRDFYAFDLGGGSLECLAFRARRPERAASLPLGCVRLTELCVPDPRAPFDEASRRRVQDVCRQSLARSGFPFELPAGTSAVFAGGTLTTARAIFARRAGRTIADATSLLAVEALRALLDETGRRPLEERKLIPGLLAARADVFPTALATVIAVAESGGFAAFHHSFHNLRYGIAAELLERAG